MVARFTDKIVLVTGGGSGIGRATAEAFAREGATVVVSGRTAESLAETVARIEGQGGRADAIPADVTRAGQVADLIGTIAARYGRLDVAFNNAGAFGAAAHVAGIDEAIWSTVLATNVTGVMLSMKYEIACMKENGGGVIINMGSVRGAHTRTPGLGAYAASKAAVSALTRTAAKEYIRDGIRINAISPGPIAAPMSRWPGESDAERDARVAGDLPIGRIGAVEEVAATVLWLASPEAGFIVGHDLVIDGGLSA
ncbi:MAG TPA: SDR family oxidoreductase [Longimicrobiales bacterium]